MPQRFKTIYFSDHPANDTRGKNLKLAFGQRDLPVYRAVEYLSSEDVRNLLGYSSYIALLRAAESESLPVNTFCLRILRRKLNGNRTAHQQLTLPGVLLDPAHATFKGGELEPLHSWYPLLEGYSPQFVEYILRNFAPKALRILDPFAGLGTTPLTAARLGLDGFYCEINPLLQFLIEVKAKAFTAAPPVRAQLRDSLLRLEREMTSALESALPDVELQVAYRSVFGKSKFFDHETFDKILRARTWVDQIACRDQATAQFLIIPIVSSLLPASLLVRAGDVRFKTPVELRRKNVNFEDSIRRQLHTVAADLNRLEFVGKGPLLMTEDAKLVGRVPSLQLDAVVTSPPYLNGTNYFRNTKIELWFLRCLGSRQQLRRFRFKSVTCGINDVTVAKVFETRQPAVQAIVNDLERVAYDARIPRMVASYFRDLDETFEALRHHLRRGATVAVDIGDSAYGGVLVPTDQILQEILREKGFAPQQELVLRRRLSRSGIKLRQVLLLFEYRSETKAGAKVGRPWERRWGEFKTDLPHQWEPYSKRNWGHPLHSLCSYGGKMKPSLAHHLVKTFLDKPGSSMLDPFAGVGTIPFEAALRGHRAFAFEISPAARVIAQAKLGRPDAGECRSFLAELEVYIGENEPTDKERRSARMMNFNSRIPDYYHPKTLGEILLARRFFLEHPPGTNSENLVFACLLHILHGNRPYALSRRSHNSTPFAPSGPAEYRPLIPRLRDKVERSLAVPYPPTFAEGLVFHQDATSWWPAEVDELDAIITSPPFFDSTRFYLANWLRLWFCGWEREDFDAKPLAFVDKRQKADFSVYQPIFRQARERVKHGGIVVFHLGKSRKCDMAAELGKQAAPWFRVVDSFSESVEHCESHGIRDKGTVGEHQYLILM